MRPKFTDYPFGIMPVEAIRRQVEEKEFTLQILSDKMGISTSAISKTFQQDGLSVYRLLTFCEAMEYNFFREFADKIPFAEPQPADYDPHGVAQQMEEMRKKVEAIERKNYELETENRILKEVMGHLTQKS